MEFQTAQILFKAKGNLLPENIQKLFTGKEGGYNLRGQFKFRTLQVRTTRKTFSISVCGIKLWNSLERTLGECPNIRQFENVYKKLFMLGTKRKRVFDIDGVLFLFFFFSPGLLFFIVVV